MPHATNKRPFGIIVDTRPSAEQIAMTRERLTRAIGRNPFDRKPKVGAA